MRSLLAAFLIDPWHPISAVVEIMNAITNSRMDQMHGDMQCPDDEGGMDCTVHRLDKGYGSPFTRSFFTDTMLTDVRARGSPPLTFWYESALRISRGAATPLARLARMSAAGATACRSQLGFLPDVYATYRVPTLGRSYMALSDPVASDQDWLVVANHMHRRASSEHWLVVSSALFTDLGVACDLCTRSPSATSLPEISKARVTDEPGAPSSDEIKRRVLAHVRRLRAEGRKVALCIDKGPQTARHVPSAAEFAIGIRDEYGYDRYSGLYCDQEGIRTPPASEGQAYATQFIFHRPVADTTEATWPMHGIIFVQGEAVTAEQADAQWVSGTYLPRTDAVRKAAALTHDQVSAYAAVALGGIVGVVGAVGCVCARRCRRSRADGAQPIPKTMR